VSQSLGHHIANRTLFEKVVGTAEPQETTPYDMCIVVNSTLTVMPG